MWSAQKSGSAVLIVEAYEEEPLVLKLGPLSAGQSNFDRERVNGGRGLLNLNSREIAFGPVNRPETHRAVTNVLESEEAADRMGRPNSLIRTLQNISPSSSLGLAMDA